ALPAAPGEWQGDEPGAPGQGADDLRRRRRLSRLEDQPPFGRGDRGEAVAAALADPRRAYSAASSVAAGGDPLRPPLTLFPLTPPSAASTAEAKAATGKGLRSTAWPARSSGSPASPT